MVEFHYIQSGNGEMVASVDIPEKVDLSSQRLPVVIVTHGLTGHRIGIAYNLVDLGRRLNEKNIICVRFDQRGCGESKGEFVELTIPKMKEDTLAVWQWVRGQSWCDPESIGLVGVSVGAIPTIGADAEHQTSGVALWAPVYDMMRVFKATAKTGLRGILEQQGWFPFKGLPVGLEFVQTMGEVQPRELLSERSSPMIVFHSKTDEVVKFEESEDYVRRCREVSRLCELVEFRNACHNFIDYLDRERILTNTVEFFERVFPAS